MKTFFTQAVLDTAFVEAERALRVYQDAFQQQQAEIAAREQQRLDAENAERLKRIEAERSAQYEALRDENRRQYVRSQSDVIAHPELLQTLVSQYAAASGDVQEAVRERFEDRIAQHLDDNSKIDFHALPFEGRLMFLPVYLGLLVGKDFPRFDFDRANTRTNEYFFNSHYGPADAAPWREKKAMIDRYLQGRWQVREIDGTTVKLWRQPDLPDVIAFDNALLRHGEVLFGIRCDTGKPYYTPLANLSHLLICGQTGKGKSVLNNGLMRSLLNSVALLDSLTIVDLKGGVELARYADLHPKIRFIDTYEALHAVIDGLVDVMHARFQELRGKGFVKATSGFHVLIVDEFAAIQSYQPPDKAAKERHAGLLSKLALLGQQARAAGIKLIVMTQRPTTDNLDSNLKANLPSAISFMMSSSQNVQAMFAGEVLPVDVTTLPRGEFVFRDDAAGKILHLRALFCDEHDMAGVASAIPQQNGGIP